MTSGPDRDADLGAFFAPKSVALIGASQRSGSVGHLLAQNLLAGTASVYLVNPDHDSILGRQAYPQVTAIGTPVDLAIIATPARTVPTVIQQCAESGVRAAIVISAGFREAGSEGARLEEEIRARRGAMRIIGPNCLGLMVPHRGLNATFAGGLSRPGTIAFLSQSGAIGTAILDWSATQNFGFSAFVSVGSMVDVDWGDLIEYFGRDPDTGTIVIYLESIGRAQRFVSAARRVALTKPLVLIKAGRSPEAARAAASHTGALTGSDEVLDAAFRRCGIVRVESIAELFDLAEALAKQPRPKGPNLTIVTNAGGPAVLATDALVAGGGRLAPLSDQLMHSLDRTLPPHWSHGNPIDVLGDATADRFVTAAQLAIRDPTTDGLLAIVTPQGMTDPTSIARELVSRVSDGRKPILTSWMGGRQMEASVAELNQANLPTFEYPDDAARIFNHMWQYARQLQALYETPTLDRIAGGTDPETARRILDDARIHDRTLLTESESKQILAAYGIPVVETIDAVNESSAIRAADALGYPVVLKLRSATLTHKAEVGGVRLNLPDREHVGSAYRMIEAAVDPAAFQGVTVQPMVEWDGFELILGSATDPQFGPIVLFGAGGRMVEVMRDRAIGLPPLNSTLAQRVMERTRIFEAMLKAKGRRRPELEELRQLMARFSWLVLEQRRIKEIDVNPLLAAGDGLIALDARMVLHPWTTPDAELPEPAIRPYPWALVDHCLLKNGISVTIRPIRPEDEPAMAAFNAGLSPDSVRRRFFGAVSAEARTGHDALVRACFAEYDRAIALVAEREDGPGTFPIVGVVRLIGLERPGQAEFALVVADRDQRQGLGTELLRKILDVARTNGFHRIIGHVLPENDAMQHVCRKLGFELSYDGEEHTLLASRDLTAP